MMFIFKLLLWQLAISKAVADYYKILGVPRNATEKQITSAYRKLAKVMHPDIAPNKEKEFVKVTEAYDVLKDPEKRAKYDRFGKEGLDQNFQEHGFGDGRGPGSSFFQDIFSQFEGFQFVFNDSDHRRRGNEPDPYEFHGSMSDYEEKVNSTKCITMILLHHPQCGHCVKFKPLFNKLTKKYKTVEFLSVNCQRNKSICNHEKISGYPTLIAYKWPSYDKLVYHGDRSEQSIDSWLTDTVINIKPPILNNFKQLEDFVGNSMLLPIIAIVNNPKSLVLPSLAMVLSGKANLSIVLANNSKIVNKISPPFTPSLLSVTNLDSMNGEWYNLKNFNFDDILLKLRHDVSKFKLSNGGTKGVYKQLTDKLIESGECGPKDAQYCFIALVKNKNASIDKILAELAHKYRNEPVKLRFYPVTGKAPFGLNIKSGVKFVAYRPKRAKFKILEGELDGLNIDNFINGVLEGSVKLNNDAQFFEFRRYEL